MSKKKWVVVEADRNPFIDAVDHIIGAVFAEMREKVDEEVREKLEDFARRMTYRSFVKILNEKIQILVAPAVEARLMSLAGELEQKIETLIKESLDVTVNAKLGKIEGYWLNEINDVVRQAVEQEILKTQVKAKRHKAK